MAQISTSHGGAYLVCPVCGDDNVTLHLLRMEMVELLQRVRGGPSRKTLRLADPIILPAAR